MPVNTLSEQLIEVVQSGMDARSRFYAAMEEPDEQELGRPATEEIVSIVESELNIKLPPSYRAFLLLHDGWTMVDASVDLYSCERLIEVARSQATLEWRRSALEAGDAFAGECIVIGGSEFTAARYLLDTTIASTTGEFPVVDYEKGIQELHEDFFAFLLKSEQGYQELTKDLLGGLDYENM